MLITRIVDHTFAFTCDSVGGELGLELTAEAAVS